MCTWVTQVKALHISEQKFYFLRVKYNINYADRETENCAMFARVEDFLLDFGWGGTGGITKKSPL